MKLKNIPIACAIPKFFTALSDAFTAEPIEQETPLTSTREELQQKMIIDLSNQIIGLESTIAKDTAAVQNNHSHVTTKEELTKALNLLVKDEKAIVANEQTPVIPHQEPVERVNGLIPSTESIDDKLERNIKMRATKTPESSTKVVNAHKRPGNIKRRDGSPVTKQMYDCVIEEFAKFLAMKAAHPDVSMNRNVFGNQMNRKFGTDKTISVWSNIYLGHTKRETLIDEADLSKTEEE